MTWFDGDGDEITEGVEKTEELLSDGKRFTVKSTLRMQAKSEHHNTTLTCRAKSAADKIAKNAEFKIEVIGLKRLFFLYFFFLSIFLYISLPFEFGTLPEYTRHERFMCVLTNQIDYDLTRFSPALNTQFKICTKMDFFLKTYKPKIDFSTFSFTLFHRFNMRPK